MNIPWYKKALGCLYPIIIARHKNNLHPDLKIRYYQGQVQLESDNALYSDGSRYAPFRKAFDYLHQQKELERINSFLLLGAGLGSALHRLHKVYGLNPKSVLVERDQNIIDLSKEYLLDVTNKNISYVATDAGNFVQNSNDVFDLIGIDLFDNLQNSKLLNEDIFWFNLKKTTHKHTRVVVNTIFLENDELNLFEQRISKDYHLHRIDRSPNYFFILKPR